MTNSKYEVETTQYGFVHYYAQCEVCNFDSGITADKTKTKAKVRNEARKHVENTGHSVVIGAGKETMYKAL